MAGTEDLDGIEEEATRRNITRLCHLTPFRNLLHIASGSGLRSVADLSNDERAVFDQQDLERYDNHPDHISCSIEYPNVWYLRRRRWDATPLQRLFPDWVCLLIDQKYLWRPGTEFSVRNAAAGGGAYLQQGFDAFRALFADSTQGAYDRRFGRDAKSDALPTDDQAEVMIPKHVPLADASTVVVADEAQANRVAAGLRLAQARLEQLQFIIAPDFFTTRLSAMLRGGEKPHETSWLPRDEHADL